MSTFLHTWLGSGTGKESHRHEKDFDGSYGVEERIQPEDVFLVDDEGGVKGSY